jgi:hypothetical protein
MTMDSRYDAVAIALAFYSGVFSFSGWFSFKFKIFLAQLF